MMTKFMNKQRGLLAAIMALVMVFAGVAIVASDTDADPTYVAEVNGTPYGTLSEAINAASGKEIKLLDDTEYDLVPYTLEPYMVVDDESVIINGDNHKLTIKNTKGFWYVLFNLELKNMVLNTENAGRIQVGDGATFKLDNVEIERTGLQYISNEGKVSEDSPKNKWTSAEGKIIINNSTLPNVKVLSYKYNGTGNMPIEAKNGTSGIIINVVGGNYDNTGASTSDVTFTAGEDLVTDSTSSFGIVKVYTNETKFTIPVGETFRAEQVVNNSNGEGIEGTFTPVETTATNINDVVTIIKNGGSAIIDTKDELILDESLILRSGQSLTIKNATIKTTDNSTITVESNANLILEAADVRVSVIEEDGAYISVTKAKKMTVTGDSTADLGVGYGNTLVLADLTVPSGKYIKAWGTIVIEGTVTVQSNNGFHVYQGGYAQIDGALVIEGTATIDGTADVNGSVKVYNKDGGAAFNVGSTGVVNVLGTMDVLKKKTGVTDNTLDIDSQKFSVEGTLTVTGTLAGNVNDMGTVVFNGTAAGTDAQITIFDGMSITIASVTGTLTIMDEMDESNKVDGENFSESNKAILKNVKNVTVSTEVVETYVKNPSARYYALAMTVTGTISAVDDTNDNKVTLSSETTDGYNKSDVTDRNITVGDITLGKGVTLDIGTTDVTVSGTVTVSAEDSDLTIADQKVVNVTGTIINVVSNGDKSAKDISESIADNVNAATYEVASADTTVTTYYFTTFENALAAVATADEKTIEVLGTIEVATALEIPAGAIVTVSGALTIAVDGTITVAADAEFNVTGASDNVMIYGMLVIMDKETGLDDDSRLTYQVLNETETSATYSGLVLALQNAVAGDVITIKQNADITKSVTIPEGVTLIVPSGKTLTIGNANNDVTLTVAGTLKVDGTVDDADTEKKVEITVPGVIMVTGALNIIPEDYVLFEMKVDGKPNTVYSNLAYAAENAVNGAVTVIGDISGGDITFTQADKGAKITITVSKDSTLSFGTLTLVGAGASITTASATVVSGEVTEKAGVINGTIASAAGSVDLVKVSGITVAIDIVTDVDGSTDVMTVYGTLAGKMTVATGTVTVNDDTTNNYDELIVGTNKDAILTVATGATLAVPENAALTVSGTATGDDAYDSLIIDGALSVVKGTVDVTGKALVNGTLEIVNSNGVEINGMLTVIGTVTVSSTTETDCALDVDGKLIVGTAPSIGANGTIVGNVALADDDCMAIVFAGADVSAALFDENNGVSSADATEVYVNGALFMTVYVNNGNSGVGTSAIDDFMVVDGYLAPVWYIDGKVATGGITDISLYERIDAVMEYDSIDLIVSAGVGLQVYIDGLSIENFVNTSTTNDLGKYVIQLGTHTVSFAVESGYDGANATITVNGVQVSNNGTFTVDVDADKITIIASGAVPAQSGSTVVVDDADDGMALTDILLIVLVVLIVIMAIIVALRMMRS